MRYYSKHYMPAVASIAVSSIILGVVFSDVPYSNQTPMSYGNSPTSKQVAPLEQFTETAYVGDKDTWDRDNGKSYPVLCNGAVSLHKTIRSGNVLAISPSFDDNLCRLTAAYTIKAKELPAGVNEEVYLDEHWGKDKNVGQLDDPDTLVMSCLVTIKRPAAPPEDPEEDGE